MTPRPRCSRPRLVVAALLLTSTVFFTTGCAWRRGVNEPHAQTLNLGYQRDFSDALVTPDGDFVILKSTWPSLDWYVLDRRLRVVSHVDDMSYALGNLALDQRGHHVMTDAVNVIEVRRLPDGELVEEALVPPGVLVERLLRAPAPLRFVALDNTSGTAVVAYGGSPARVIGVAELGLRIVSGAGIDFGRQELIAVGDEGVLEEGVLEIVDLRSLQVVHRQTLLDGAELGFDVVAGAGRCWIALRGQVGKFVEFDLETRRIVGVHRVSAHGEVHLDYSDETRTLVAVASDARTTDHGILTLRSYEVPLDAGPLVEIGVRELSAPHGISSMVLLPDRHSVIMTGMWPMTIEWELP